MLTGDDPPAPFSGAGLTITGCGCGGVDDHPRSSLALFAAEEPWPGQSGKWPSTTTDCLSLKADLIRLAAAKPGHEARPIHLDVQSVQSGVCARWEVQPDGTNGAGAAYPLRFLRKFKRERLADHRRRTRRVATLCGLRLRVQLPGQEQQEPKPCREGTDHGAPAPIKCRPLHAVLASGW
jgi:hypothetical protein